MLNRLGSDVKRQNPHHRIVGDPLPARAAKVEVRASGSCHVLIVLLLGKGAGTCVVSVADNVARFSAAASSDVLGIVIVPAIVYLALRGLNPAGDTRGRTRG